MTSESSPEEIFRQISDLYKEPQESRFPVTEIDNLDTNFQLPNSFMVEYDEFINNISPSFSYPNQSFSEIYLNHYAKIQSTKSESENKFIRKILLKCILHNKQTHDGTLEVAHLLIFDSNFFPNDPTESKDFSTIQTINYFLYQLFTIYSEVSRGSLLSELNQNINSITQRGHKKFIYNFFPFFIKLIDNLGRNNLDSCLIHLDSLFRLSMTDSVLFYFTGKLFECHPQFLLKSLQHQQFRNYIQNYFKEKSHRQLLLTSVVKGISQLNTNGKENESINDSFILLNMVWNDLDLDDYEVFLNSFIPIISNFNSEFFQKYHKSTHSLVKKMSKLSSSSPKLFFKFLHFISRMNIPYDLFDLTTTDVYFNNLKQCNLERCHLFSLFQFALTSTFEKDQISSQFENVAVSDDSDYYVQNWRGIELILAYIELAELQIASKFLSIQSRQNVYHFEKARLAEFIINRLHLIDNKEICNAYIGILSFLSPYTFSSLNFFRLTSLIKRSSYAEQLIALLQSLLRNYTHETRFLSFFRFDRSDHYLQTSPKAYSNSISIYFAFELKFPQLCRIFTLQLKNAKYHFDIFGKFNLQIEEEKANSHCIKQTAITISQDKWNFMHVKVTNFTFSTLFNINGQKDVKFSSPLSQFPNKVFRTNNEFSLLFNNPNLHVSSIFAFRDDDKHELNFHLAHLRLHKSELTLSHKNQLLYCIDSSLISKNSNFVLDELNLKFTGRVVTYPHICDRIFFSNANESFVRRTFQLFECLQVRDPSTSRHPLLKLIIAIIEQFAQTITKTKSIELLCIFLSKIDPNLVKIDDDGTNLDRLFNLKLSPKLNKLRIQLYQSFFMNFEFISKISSEAQTNLLTKILNEARPDYVEFESIIHNAALFYQDENDNSNLVYQIVSKLFRLKYIDCIIYTISTSNSVFVVRKCIEILMGIFSQNVEQNHVTISDDQIDIQTLKNQFLFLILLLSEQNDWQIQLSGFNLLIRFDEWCRKNQSEIKPNEFIYLLMVHLNDSIEGVDSLLNELFGLILSNISQDLCFQNVFLFPLFVHYCSKSTNAELLSHYQNVIADDIEHDIIGTSCILDIPKWYFWITQFFSSSQQLHCVLFALLSQHIVRFQSDCILDEVFNFLSLTLSNSADINSLILQSLLLNDNDISLVFPFISQYLLFPKAVKFNFSGKNFFDLLNSTIDIEIINLDTNLGCLSKIFIEHLLSSTKEITKLSHNLILIAYLYSRTKQLRTERDNQSILNEISSKLEKSKKDIEQACLLILNNEQWPENQIFKKLELDLNTLEQRSEKSNFLINFRNSFYAQIYIDKNDYNAKNYLINYPEYEKYKRFNEFVIATSKMHSVTLYKSYQSQLSQNTLNEKYILTNQISLHGSRILMKIDHNSDTDHENIIFENDFPQICKFTTEKQEYLRKQGKHVYDVMYIDISHSLNGVLSSIDNIVYFQGITKTIKIYLSNVDHIFNRIFTKPLASHDEARTDFHGCELFTKRNRSYCFLFLSETDRNNFYADINMYPQDKLLQGIQQKWENKKLSTYEYLYSLNMITNRSFHIIQRYPIFPIILKKTETMAQLNFSNPDIFRDLSLTTYRNINKDDISPMTIFPLTDVNIFKILVRAQPFTKLEIRYQRQIDTQRLFDSTEHFWPRGQDKCAPEIPPEIFTFPFYLINENGLDLGKKNHDIKLPDWCLNCFVYTSIQRVLLESEFVRDNLMEWFDFIFGQNQNQYKESASLIYNPILYSDDVARVGCLPDQLQPKQSKSAVPFSQLWSHIREDKSNILSPNLTNYHIIDLKKEVFYAKKDNKYFLINNSLEIELKNDYGCFVAYSKKSKLALFVNFGHNYLTVKSLQDQSESLQCHTGSCILALTLIGDVYLALARDDGSLQIWNMSVLPFVLISESFYHNDEIVSIGGNHDLGLIVSIDKNNMVVIETLYTHHFISKFPLIKQLNSTEQLNEDMIIDDDYENCGPLIHVFKSGLICICVQKKLYVLDIRGKTIQAIQFDHFIHNSFKQYSSDKREFLIIHLLNHSILVYDLTIFGIIGQISIEDKFNVHICPLKGQNSILFEWQNHLGKIDFSHAIPIIITKENPRIHTLRIIDV